MKLVFKITFIKYLFYSVCYTLIRFNLTRGTAIAITSKKAKFDICFDKLLKNTEV